jgi:hypothetical protein
MALWHGRQLEEIACDDKLDTSKRPAIVPYLPGNFFKLVEQVSVNHGHLIDDKNFRAQPAISRLLVFLDLRNVSDHLVRRGSGRILPS